MLMIFDLDELDTQISLHRVMNTLETNNSIVTLTTRVVKDDEI
jgi:two-component sensor histidine kinase